MALDRQEKALREFKQIMADLVLLLRASTNAQLSYMCWVNHSREQFVWETNSTVLSNVMFQDRVNFEHHFLNQYKTTQEIIQLRIGEDVSKGKLMHYFDVVHAKSMLIIPFINKGETVALTVLESENEFELGRIHSNIVSYNNAMVNVLDTYLEVVDLHEQQGEWEEYEASLNKINYRMHRVEILKTMLNEMQACVPSGGVSLLSHGMNSWNVVLSAEKANNPIQLGLKMEDRSISSDALNKGEPVFSMHFNNNPKRISAGEGRTIGASYAIPILIYDRRQALAVVYDDDPLTFKESTKHKLTNLARSASLNIQASVKKSSMAEDLLTQSFSAYMPELWEAALELQLKAYKSNNRYKTWFGLVSPDNVSQLRTKYRLEDLQRIQEDFVNFLNPSVYGFSGYIGFNSDYVYTVIIQGETDDVVTQWMGKFNTRLAHGLKLSNGHTINIDFKVGYTQVDENCANAYQMITKAKKAHAEAVTSSENKAVVV